MFLMYISAFLRKLAAYIHLIKSEFGLVMYSTKRGNAYANAIVTTITLHETGPILPFLIRGRAERELIPLTNLF